MNKEDKDLLLKDLSSRLPYGVKVQRDGEEQIKDLVGIYYLYDIPDKVKPYLRPMSSMTEEERREFESIWDSGFGKALDAQISNFDDCVVRNLEIIASSNAIDWLNAHHFDYRNLIEKGIAIAVTEENNPYK